MDRRFKKIMLPLLILFLALPALTAYGATIDPEDLEAFFAGMFAVQMEQYHVPGISVAVVQDGEIIFSKGYGVGDLEKKTAIDPKTTLHRPGSNTKLLTWTAVLQLYERELLDLHEDINHYLDFFIPEKLANGQLAPHITLHHLLTHTAGFEETINGIRVLEPEDLVPLGDYVRKNLPGRVFPPGTIMSYSNYGTALAGYIVELVSGQPFFDYVAENIFRPLQMEASSFLQPLPEKLAERMSKGYIYKEGKYLPGDLEYIQAYPAGALTASTQDMANLMIAFLQLGALGEERILEEETALLMQKTHFTSHPGLSGMAYGFIEDEINGVHILAHGGNTRFFQTGLYLLPEKQTGLYLSYNSTEAINASQAVFEQFVNRYFLGSEENFISEPRPVSPGTERNYTGLFHSSRSNYTKWEAVVRFLQNVKVVIDEDGYLLLNFRDQQERYGDIGAGLFQSLNNPDKKIAVSFDDGRVMKIYFPGPASLLRTSWYHYPQFIITLLIAASLFMFAVLIGWIRRLFHKDIRRGSFFVPKLLGLLFIIVFFTLAFIFFDLILDFHPQLGLPLIFMKPAATLSSVFWLAKFLMGLNILMLVVAVYYWIKRRGSLWQRTYHSLLTLFGGSVIWILWQINLL